MKKVLLFVIAFLLMASLSYADQIIYSPSYANAIPIFGHGAYNQPVQEIVRVRYGVEGLSTSSLVSGQAVIWDTTSADGITVGPSYGNNDEGRFAGVLVTPLKTQDVGGTGDIRDDNYGYMCVRGYVIASMDTAITAGAATVRLQVTPWGGLGHAGGIVSSDVGTLLKTSVAGTGAPVWLE